MDLKAFDNIYIWGTAFRGGQIYNELTNQNIKVTAFIDSYKRNEEIDGIAVLFPAQVLCDENVNAVIIIASLKYESNEQIKGAITNSKYRGKFFTNYEYYMNYERNFLLKESQEEVLLEDSFDKKIANWFDTFLSEVDFWRNQVANPKGEWNWCYRGKFQKKQFSCERLPFKINGDETILDVGCGICSPYGKYLDEKKINLVQVDPLAEFYNQINSRFVIAEKEDEEVDLVHFGMFEFLTYQFGCEYADVILIDNALDHCIDPYCALCECISTVKKGGTVSLKHHENEAFRENYAGLHQWNIFVNEYGELFFWNKNTCINVNKLLEEYVEIKAWHEEGNLQYNPYGAVVCNLTKKKDFVNNTNLKEKVGVVMSEMMRKMADVKYATDMIRTMW